MSWFKEENLLIAANNAWLVVGQCTGVDNGMTLAWARCSYSSGLEACNPSTDLLNNFQLAASQLR